MENPSQTVPPPLLQSRYNDGVPFQIRQFQKTDFDTLWRIDQSCFDPQLAYSRPEMAFYMRRPGSFTLVAEDEGGEVPVSYTHLDVYKRQPRNGAGKHRCRDSCDGSLSYLTYSLRS